MTIELNRQRTASDACITVIDGSEMGVLSRVPARNKYLQWQRLLTISLILKTSSRQLFMGQIMLNTTLSSGPSISLSLNIAGLFADSC